MASGRYLGARPADAQPETRHPPNRRASMVVEAMLVVPAGLQAQASFQAFGKHAWSFRLSAALTTQFYHYVWFSQKARGYSGLLFWTLLANGLLLRGLRDSRPRTWLHYAAAVALGAYTQLTMLFVVAGDFVIYVIAIIVRQRRQSRRGWAGLWLGFGLGGPLAFQLYSLVLPHMPEAGCAG